MRPEPGQYGKPNRSESQSLDDKPIDLASLLPQNPPGAEASRRAEERVVRTVPCAAKSLRTYADSALEGLQRRCCCCCCMRLRDIKVSRHAEERLCRTAVPSETFHSAVLLVEMPTLLLP